MEEQPIDGWNREHPNPNEPYDNSQLIYFLNRRFDRLEEVFTDMVTEQQVLLDQALSDLRDAQLAEKARVDAAVQDLENKLTAALAANETPQLQSEIQAVKDATAGLVATLPAPVPAGVDPNQPDPNAGQPTPPAGSLSVADVAANAPTPVAPVDASADASAVPADPAVDPASPVDAPADAPSA